jgi:hypothetical protein
MNYYVGIDVAPFSSRVALLPDRPESYSADSCNPGLGRMPGKVGA